MYQIEKMKDIKIKNPILIEGLPGIGNVGKIALDFLIDSLNAEKIIEIYSYKFPHAVFVNEENLVELPVISLYYKKVKSQNILLLAGDIQPIDESSCYQFCHKVLDIVGDYNTKEIITLGGIGLKNLPEAPKVYSTSNNKEIIKKYKYKNLTNKIYGKVGPILGVSGLLIGLAQKKKIPAIALLAETYGHPTHLGIKGAREILKILDKRLSLNLDFKRLNKEIKESEDERYIKAKDLIKLQKPRKNIDPTDYIG